MDRLLWQQERESMAVMTMMGLIPCRSLCQKTLFVLTNSIRRHDSQVAYSLTGGKYEEEVLEL